MGVLEIFIKGLTGSIYENLEVRVVCEMVRWDSLKLLNISKEKGKIVPLRALYSGKR